MQVVSFNNYAGFSARFIAFLIDRVVIWLALVLGIGQLTGTGTHVSMFHWHHLFSPDHLLIELLMMAYFVTCETSAWQGTIGKKIMGLKVTTEQYQKLQTKDAIIRFLAKYLSAAIFLLGFIWVIFDKRKQGWHDRIANTFVITN